MAYEEFKTVLIVDDNKVNLQILRKLLEPENYQIIEASGGQEALALLELDKPDIVLLDIMMPDLDGYEVCSIMKSMDETKDIPVIFITAKTNNEDMIRGFDAGGVDYIFKPFYVPELKARVNTHVRLKKSLDKLSRFNLELKVANETIGQQNEKLMEVMSKLEHASQTDPMTGLYNRRYLNERIQEEAVRFARSRRQFSVILCDVDFFKEINDNYGHDCGDYVLKSLSTMIRGSIRKQDYLARWGGEEFLILLPETGVQGATILAEGLRKKVETMELDYNSKKLNVKMTFGVAEFDQETGTDAMIIRADNALYNGKNHGRNCVRSI